VLVHRKPGVQAEQAHNARGGAVLAVLAFYITSFYSKPQLSIEPSPAHTGADAGITTFNGNWNSKRIAASAAVMVVEMHNALTKFFLFFSCGGIGGIIITSFSNFL